MALEDLTGAKTIDSLDRNNPTGADGKSFGDDHIRGFKNVLLNTFPNVTGPVTKTQAQLDELTFPVGTKMAFFQAAAPTGWTQDVTNNDAMLRVVSGAGGGVGGSGSPTAGPTITNSHILSLAEMPIHTHTFTTQLSVNAFAPGGAVANTSAATTSTGSAGSNQGHTHSISFAPKFIDMIICTKN